MPSCMSMRDHYKLPPLGGTAEQPTGATIIEFAVQPSGVLIFAKVLCPSGSANLDSLALGEVEHHHFPPLPAKQPKAFVVPVVIGSPPPQTPQ